MHYVYRFRREAERGREAGGERSGVRTQIGPPLILKDEVRAPPTTGSSQPAEVARSPASVAKGPVNTHQNQPGG